MVGRRVCALLGLLLLLAACGGDGEGGSDLGAGAAARPVVEAFGQTFMDPTRPTEDARGRRVADARTLDVLVLQPADTGEDPLPLVVFGHGYGSRGPALAGLLQTWAEAGYVVVAPTYPTTNGAFAPTPDLAGYVEQPGDVSFLLDELLRLDAEPGSPLHDRIDEDRIAVGGHSLGAVTSMGLTINSCCRDDRVDAIIPVAGHDVPFPGGDYDYRSDVPSLFVHGDADLDFQRGRAMYEQAPEPAWFLTLLGADHQFFGGRWDEPLSEAVVAFLDATLGGDPGARERLEDVAVPGKTTIEVRAANP